MTAPAAHNVAPTTSPILLNARTAAQTLSLSPRTLWTLTNRGEIPVVRISSRCLRYRLVDLEEWTARRTSTSRDPIPLIRDRKAAP